MLFVLTGPVHSGKTTLVAAAAARWETAGLDVGGFLSVARSKDAGEPGYDLVDLRDGTVVPFLTRKGEPDWPSVGPWHFIPAVLEKANSILRRDRDADILVVDEIGPLELDGEGLWPAFLEARSSGARCLCVVRDSILEEFRAKISPPEPMIFRHDAPGVLESLTGALTADCAGLRSLGRGA